MKDPDVYFHKRPENGILYFRRSIPPALQPFVNLGNKREIVVSLKSQTFTKEARARHHELWMESERIIEEARKRAKAAESGGAKICNGSGPKDTLKRRTLVEFAENEIVSIVQRWFLSEQAAALEKYRVIYNFSDLSEQNQTASALEARLAAIDRSDGSAKDLETFTVKRAILEDAGGVVEVIKRGKAISLDQKFTALTREALRMVLRYSLEIVKTGAPPAIESTSPEFSPNALNETIKKPSSVTLNGLIERFSKSKGSSKQEKTMQEYGIVFNLLRNFVGGETPIDSITRDQMRELQNLYSQVPAHAFNSTSRKLLIEIVDSAKKEKREPMARTTYNKRISLVSALFHFALKEGLLKDFNPAAGLALENETYSDEEKPFTIQQLQAVFTGKIYQQFIREPDAKFTPNHPLKPHLFWAPLIALFQGMRTTEILQLRLNDISEQDGVPCIRVTTDFEGQRVKNKPSRRRIPIHPFLIELGFLTFVTNARKAGHGDLFEDASHGRSSKQRSSRFSKRINRYLKAVGVKKDRSICFHSFRHTFVDGLRNAGVPEDMRQRLGGWTGSASLERHYGGRIQPKLAELLSMLKFEGLNLSYLTGEPKSSRKRASLPPVHSDS